MVGQHDAARANADCFRRGSYMPDDHTGGRAGDPAHPVMFGNPVTAEAQTFCMGSKIGGIGQRASH